MIDLALCMTVKSAELKAQKRHALEVLLSFGPNIIAACLPSCLHHQHHQLCFTYPTLQVSTPETTFLMFADSEKEKDDWIGELLCITVEGQDVLACIFPPSFSQLTLMILISFAGSIGRAIVRCSNTYTHEDGADDDGDDSD